MRERVQNLINRLQDRWNSLERSQKVRLVATILVLLVFLVVTVYFVTKPRRIVLRSNLDPATAGEIQNALTEENIRSWLTNGATAIEIDEKNRDMATVTLAIKNVPSDKEFTYEAALSASGMGTTETIQRSNLKRAAETDLERTLRIFDGIESANVTITLPDTTNFIIESQERATAMVVVTLNKNVDESNWQGVARLITRGVKGLEIEDVEIRDQNYRVLYSGAEEQTGGYTSGYEIERQRNIEEANKVKSLLAPLFDDIKVAPMIKVNTDKTVIEQDRYRSPLEDSDTGLGLVEHQTIDRQNATGTSPDGEPGVGSNDNAMANYQVGNAATTTANTNSSDTSYLHDRTKEITEVGIGDIIPTQSSMGIIGYTYKIYNQKYMQDNNLLGTQTWDEFKASQANTLLAIDPTLLANVQAAVGFENISLISYEVPQFIDYIAEPLKIEQIVMFAIMALLILLLGIGLIRAAQTEEVTEVEPELSVEDLLVSTQLEEEKETDAQKLAEVDFEKESETKKLIEKFITDKPESVAQLLRNWLNEDEWNS